MITKAGLTQMTVAEFEAWINNTNVARTIVTIQMHHTYSPSYAMFNGENHFELQQMMLNFHVNHNGWHDIGQHFTIFPDGSIVTGRSLEQSPACISGQNANAICIENLGNFDIGKDTMTAAHRAAVVSVTAILCARFQLPVTTNTIVYHHWFDLASGHRNNGTKNNKSCPGTDFFNGNKVSDCEAYFLPLVKAKLSPIKPVEQVIKYVSVTAPVLNIRTQPGALSPKVSESEPAVLGSVLRVYEEKNGWFRISASQPMWVSAKHTRPVLRATVTANTLNARNGPGNSFDKIGIFTKGQELFLAREVNNWIKISMDNKWVSKDFLTFA